MVTTYDYIFTEFKDKITDPDLLLLSENLQEEMLTAIMNKSISRCKRICKPIIDLTVRNDKKNEFMMEIPDEIVDIITEWMTVFWLEPYLNNIENPRNALSTKDFSVFSPANLLEKVSDRYERARKHARSLTNDYSYTIADLRKLKS